MAKQFVGIVYDTRTLALRRIVIPDDDIHLGAIHTVGTFEAMVFHPRWKGWDIPAALDAIRLHSGREPPSLEMIHTLGL